MTNLAPIDLAGVLLGFFFTLCVFSYIIGDNPLFRIAIHIFIGVSAGYAAVVAWYNVIWPQMILPLLIGSMAERTLLVVPALLSLLLLFKSSVRFSGFGSLPVAFLVGVGAATAIGGAVLGTLFPQIGASVNLFDRAALPVGLSSLQKFAENALILLSTLATFIYFQFSGRSSAGQAPRRAGLVEAIAWSGKIVIAFTFGALFAGVYMASLSAMIERLSSLIRLIFPA